MRPFPLSLPNDALERVIELYWKPVYRFIRLKFRKNNEDAKDLTQSFFTSALACPTGGYGNCRIWVCSRRRCSFWYHAAAPSMSTQPATPVKAALQVISAPKPMVLFA